MCGQRLGITKGESGKLVVPNSNKEETQNNELQRSVKSE